MSNEIETMMKKKSKRALTPKLRFPEFADDGAWDAKSLDDLCERLTETVGDVELTPVSISSGKGFVPQAEKFGRDISGAQYSKYIRIRRGDFAYNRGNSKRFPQGCVYPLVELDEAAASNAFYCFRLNPECEPAFFCGLFEKNAHGRQLIKFITSSARGTGLLNISADAFFGITIPMPKSLREQQKIAECLSSLDGLIAAEGRMLEALKAHKKGLMQQLFPQPGQTQPRLRFPEFRDKEGWKAQPLDNVSQFVKKKIPLHQLNLDTYVSTENLSPDYGGIEQASKLPPNGSATEYKPDDILIANIRPYLKKVWRSNRSGGASNDVIVIRAKALLRKDYLSMVIANDAFINYVMKTAKGVKMPRGDIASMKEYIVHYPTPREQQAIADCLTALDTRIAAQAAKIDALKQHKRGLMQQLFPAPEEQV